VLKTLPNITEILNQISAPLLDLNGVMQNLAGEPMRSAAYRESVDAEVAYVPTVTPYLGWVDGLVDEVMQSVHVQGVGTLKSLAAVGMVFMWLGVGGSLMSVGFVWFAAWKGWRRFFRRFDCEFNYDLRLSCVIYMDNLD
jgi:hypothetical protein